MKLIKDIFIKRPMFWQYYFSILLEFPVIFWICKNFPDTKKEWALVIIYFILSLLFYILSYNDTKVVFLSVKNQLDRYPTTNFLQYFILSILACFKYIFLAVFLKIALPKVANIIIVSVIMYFILSTILFSASHLPPIVILMYAAIPLAIFSLVGIEKSLLNWTFVSLLLISVIPQFINEDVEKLLPRNLLIVLTGNRDNKSVLTKEKFLKLKYQIFIFVPFLYIALVIAEKIIYSNEFNYFFNYIFDKHDNLQSIDYLSQTNLMITGMKIFIVSFLVIPYSEYGNYIIDVISKFLVKVIEKNDNDIEYSGVYIRVKYKKLRRKWHVDYLDYYFCYKRWFYNHKEGRYYLSRKDILTSNKEKKIKPITDEIFRVESDYYVDYNSRVLRQLPSSNRIYGYKLLNRPDHFVMLFPLTIIILMFLLNSRNVDEFIHKNLRGDYVLANVENRSIKNVDESKKIQFKDNEILFNKQRYKVNNVTMQILDSNADVVGEYTKQGVLVFKNDSQNESHYILKSSRLYKNTTKK